MKQKLHLSKKERRELRKEQKRAERQGLGRRQLLARFGLGTTIILILGGIGWIFFRNAITPLPGTFIPSQGRQHISPGQPHEPYNSNPPTSGPHYTQQANWGIHETTIPEEYQLHNLEHGGVIVHYKCPSLSSEGQATSPASPAAVATPAVIPSSPAAESSTLAATPASRSADQAEIACAFLKAQLESVVRPYDAKVILMPNPNIETTIALTAWTRIDTFDILDTDRIKRFIDAYRNRGPENVPDDIESVHFD